MMAFWRFLLGLTVLAAVSAPAHGRRDPFAAPPAHELESVGPLQQLILERVRLAAIASDGQRARALLQDENAMGYIVSLGAAVGARGGVVTAIESDRLVIEEAPDGVGSKRQLVFVLHRDEATKP